MTNITLVSGNVKTLGPVVLPVSKDLLSRSTIHPLYPKLRLMACHLYGKVSKTKESCETIIAAWRPASQSQYASALKKWNQFCVEKKINPHSASVLNGLDFLQFCFNKGMSYSVIGTAWSVLSFVLPRYNCSSFGEHFLV